MFLFNVPNGNVYFFKCLIEKLSDLFPRFTVILSVHLNCPNVMYDVSTVNCKTCKAFVMNIKNGQE